MTIAFQTIVLFWLVCVDVVRAFVPPPDFSTIFRHDEESTLQANDKDQGENFQPISCDRHRRDMLISLSCLGTAITPVSSLAADEIYDGRTPLLELSRQIRKSAVQGAQIIDKIDGKWERFSDDFGLGRQRNKPKVDRLNKVVVSENMTPINDLNENLASAVLQEVDVVSSIFNSLIISCEI